MKRLFAKNFATVVMDGSDENVLRTITDAIDLVTKERHGASVCRDFDSARPSMKVIETCTDEKTYEKIRGMIESSYPGLCVFNAAV